jgi:hypothetical protein
MNIDQEGDTEVPKERPAQCQFFNYKLYSDCPELNPSLCSKKLASNLSYDIALDLLQEL